MKFKDIIRKLPLFILFFAVYPSLTYLAWNIREADAHMIYRPLLVSLVMALGIWAILRLITRDWIKAALLAATILVIFFSYGHLENALRGTHLLAGKNAWHYVLIPACLLLLAGAFRHILRRVKDTQRAVLALNIISFLLLLSPLYTIFSTRAPAAAAVSEAPPAAQASTRPDIYYIILDGYSRQDTLQALGYDNKAFRSALEEMGFYIAPCSQSNYRSTLLSLSSSLNMDYLWRAIPNEGLGDKNLEPIYDSLVNNRVRRELKGLGYTIVAFETGYEWNEWKDADVYLRPEDQPFTASWLHPFEYGFMQTTALDPFIGNGLFARERFVSHHQRVQYILEQLPKVASAPGPKFVFAHILVPHAPFIFLPDGSINPDINYYITQNGTGESKELQTEGYLNNVQFVDAWFPQVLEAILEKSSTPPVIIVQGDHGLISEQRKYNILNAYYFPGNNDQALYPEITPVNTFRIIFNKYLDGAYDLRKDQSINTDLSHPYWKDLHKPFPESCP